MLLDALVLPLPAGMMAFTAAVVLVAAWAHALTGQGFAQVAAPLLLLALEPRLVVPLNLMLASVVCAAVVAGAPRQVRLDRLLIMATASVLGAPIGAYVLTAVASSTLKLLIAAVVVVFTIPMLFGLAYRLRRERPAAGVVGFVAGVLASATSASGPPVVLFLVNQGWPKEALRPSFSAFFLFSNLVALGAIILSGGLPSATLATGVWLLPLVVIGMILGTRSLPMVDAARFRQLSLLVVLLAGLVAILSEVCSLAGWR